MARNSSKSCVVSMDVLRSFSSLVSFFSSLKSPKKNMLAVDFDSTDPLFSRLIPMNAFKSAFCKRSDVDVHLVCGTIGLPKVFNSVICFIKIDVINLLRKVAMMPKKNQSMFKRDNFFAKTRNYDLSVLRPFYFANLQSSRNTTCFSSLVRAFPNKTTNGWLVIKKLFKKLLCNVCSGKIFSAHAFAPFSDVVGSNLAALQRR